VPVEIPSERPPACKGMPIRVLVADDNETARRVASQTLALAGYQADVASNNLEVLAAVDRQSYDLIFMDIEMPGLDGLEAIRKIRQRSSGNDGPYVVAVAAGTAKADIEAYLAAGMNACVNKPVSAEQLQLELRRCLEARGGAEATTVRSPDSSSGAARTPNWFQSDQPEYQNLIKKLRELFLQDTPPRLVASRQAIREGDVTKLKRQAHSLKGSCAQSEARVMATISADLENCAKNNSFELAAALLGKLEHEFEQLRAAWTEPPG